MSILILSNLVLDIGYTLSLEIRSFFIKISVVFPWFLGAIKDNFGVIVAQINSHFLMKTLKSVLLSINIPFVGHGGKVEDIF